MAGEWRETTLGEVLTLQRGFDLPETERKPGPYPVVASTGPVGTHSQAMVKGPGVVIGRSGSLGGGQYIERDFWPLNTTLWVKDFRGSDRRFCYYLLKSLDLAHFNAGSGVPTLNRNHIHPLPVRVPREVEEQRAIANVLGTLDDKIELNRRMNETLEAMARALFKSWFVDFLPVRAKMAARTQTGDPLPASAGQAGGRAKCRGVINHAPTQWSREILDLFPNSFEDSEVGEIPKGWEVGAFADTIETLGGGTPKTSVPGYWNGAIPWFSVVDAPSEADVWAIHTEKKITQAGIENSSTQILPVGTTIITARGTVGRIALVGVPMAMNQSCYGLRGKADIYGYYTYFATRQLVSSLQQRAHGSVFDTITRDTLAGVSVVIPSVPLVKAYEEKIASMLERIRSSLFESRTLAALRDTLLPQLISGELRVKAAEKLIELKI